MNRLSSKRLIQSALLLAVTLAGGAAFATDSDTVDLRDKKEPLIPVIPPMPKRTSAAPAPQLTEAYAALSDWMPKEPKPVHRPTAVAAVRG